MGINQILNEDDRIAELDDWQVKDLWVRHKLYIKKWNQMRERYLNPLATRHHDRLEMALNPTDPHLSIGEWAADNLKGDIVEEINDEYDGDVTECLWHHMTGDNMDEAAKIQQARVELSHSISGCCGMPEHKIIREGLEVST